MARRRSCPIGARAALAAADRRRDADAQPEREHAAPRTSRSTGRSSSSRATTTSGSPPRCSGGAAPSRWRRSFLLPVIGLALRRRWAAFTLGGTLIVLLLMEVPWLFVHLSDAVSLSQSRRAAGFAPLPFAFAGDRGARRTPEARAAGRARRRDRPAAALARRLRVRPAARRPGARDVGRARRRRGRRSSSFLALRRPPLREHHTLGAAAVCAFVLPVFVHGVAHWSPRPEVRSARALAAARPQPAHEGAEGRDRDRAARDELRVAATLRSTSSPRRSRTSRTRRRTTRTAASRAVHHWVLTNDPRSPGATARPGRSAAAVSIVCRGEGAARHAVLPARRGRRRTASAEVRDASAGARDRDARARARRLRSGSTATTSCSRRRSPGCTARATSGRRAASRPRSCTARPGSSGVEAGAARRAPAARARRERQLEPDRDPGGDPHRRSARGSTSSSPRRRRRRCTWSARRSNARPACRGSPTCATRSSRIRTATPSGCSCALKEQGEHAVATLVTRSADAIVCVSEAIADEMRERAPAGEVVTIANGSDFDDFAGLEHTAVRPLPASRTPARSSASAIRARSSPRCARPGSTSRSASSATSARPTASGPSSSGSATGSS